MLNYKRNYIEIPTGHIELDWSFCHVPKCKLEK